MQRRLTFQGTTLEYEFTPKRVKNMNLRVRSDGSVAVSAPRWVTKGQVEDFLRARWDWLTAAREGAESRALPAFGWQPGEQFHLLGRPVTVEHRKGPKAACLQGDTLVLTLPDPQQAEAVGLEWYEAFCRERLPLLEQAAWERFRVKWTAKPTLRLRWMTSRWGSCVSQKGIITLNKRLFSLPVQLAEYVLLHEYCHLLHPDHQQGFYALLEEFVPHRKQLDKQLKSGKFRFVR